MLSVDDFKKISLDDKPVFDKHYKKYPSFHSDNVFTTLVSWKNYANYCYKVIEDNLIILSKIDGKVQIRFPIGKKKKSVFDKVLQLSKEQNSEYPVSFIDENSRKWVEKNYPNLKIEPFRDYFDYVYLTKDLADLSGSKYKKIRNRLNKFNRIHKHKIEEITEGNLSEVKKFLKRWCLWKDCESDKILKNEKKAVFYSMRHFEDLDLRGVAIRINDKIQAISVYEEMKPDMLLVHYEKASPDYDGLYKAINQETAESVKNDYKYINRESDLGIKGLRRAKKSYRPHHMIKVYSIHKKNL